MVTLNNQMPMEPHVPIDHIHGGQIDDNLLQGDQIQEENDEVEEQDAVNVPPQQRSEPSDHLD